MTLHLLKLSVGSETVQDLEDWIERRLFERVRQGEARQHTHITRMTPRRRSEVLDGGSMYWVIKGAIAVRQRLVDLLAFTDPDGIGRCRLVLEPELHPVVPRLCRPFQGWRYLQERDAPGDLTTLGCETLPEELRRELAVLGLL